MEMRKRLFTSFYRGADTPEELVWHKPEPPELLRTIAERRTPGRALDVGCGEGVNATFLAQQGWSVVGVDFVEEALDLAGERASGAGVDLELIQADVLEFEPSDTFDLVVDSGCLHHIGGRSRSRYGTRLRSWLAPDADYLLVHFGMARLSDWRPMGPIRRRKASILAEFPEFRLEAYDTIPYDMPFPLGPVATAGAFWLRSA